MEMYNVVEMFGPGHTHFRSRRTSTGADVSWYRNLFDRSDDAMVLVAAEDDEILDANPSALAMIGVGGADVGRNADILPGFARLKDARVRSRFEIESEDRILQVTASDVVAGGQQALLVVFRDLTTLRRAEQALRESEERYTLVAYGANDGLWDWHIGTNRVFFSPRWKSMLGYQDDEVGESPNEWFARVHPEDLEKAMDAIEAVAEQRASNFEIELRTLHKDGIYRWMLVRGLSQFGEGRQLSRMAGSQSDITERRTAEEQLVRRALYDSLTDLPNRALFMDRLKHSYELTHRRRGYGYAVLFIDIDRFKVVNDSLGHLVGDQLLVGIARRLEGAVRPTDTFARLGGDEFAVLLDDVTEVGQAQVVADRIKGLLANPFTLGSHSVFTTASIGIAMSTEAGSAPEDLLREADVAMYRAKSVGKARYEVYDSTKHNGAAKQLQLENDLRGAIERNEFVLHYQPIVSLDTGAVDGFEALVRWQHPERGMVPPNDFIPVAEETGLIVPLGHWVLREACRQTREWQRSHGAHPHLTVSVNISTKQFNGGKLLEHVGDALRDSGLSAQYLKLEITETALAENAEAAATLLSRLRAMGIAVLIDDFGTGYSSLSYLHNFPIDVLKIDRSFVCNIKDREGKNFEIVRSITMLAHTLGLAVVAEGVETAQQLGHLKALKAEFGQGYYFSKPLEGEKAAALLEANHRFAIPSNPRHFVDKGLAAVAESA